MAPSSQRLSPINAARKLGVLLSATPTQFQAKGITREELDAMQANPPEWLATLRKEGPHPKQVVAARLGISNSGLARGGITEPLTSAQIRELLDEMPDWLAHERDVHRGVLAEEERLKAKSRTAR